LQFEEHQEELTNSQKRIAYGQAPFSFSLLAALLPLQPYWLICLETISCLYHNQKVLAYHIMNSAIQFLATPFLCKEYFCSSKNSILKRINGKQNEIENHNQ
jgi:hypothetical protein